MCSSRIVVISALCSHYKSVTCFNVKDNYTAKKHNIHTKHSYMYIQILHVVSRANYA